MTRHSALVSVLVSWLVAAAAVSVIAQNDFVSSGWANVMPIGKGRDQRTITVETMLYDLTKGTPMWAAVTRTTDPKDVQSYAKGLAQDVVKRLESEGLVRTRPR
jgi:hypothetical protein